MDPYEILGVRPSAGSEEIELAYKGRRSQYHPDRYAQSDAETQAWATAKMQNVNEAYRVLTSPELRAGFDRRRPSSGTAGQPSQQARPAPALNAMDAASVLLKPEWEWFHDKVYARPNIPHKKLEGAITSYAPGVSPGAVLVLLDDTLFGGAKEGLLVTNDAIYCKQKFESPRRIAFSQVAEVAPGTDSRLMVNGREFFKADLIDHLAVLTFASRLSHVFQQATPPSDAGKPRAASGVENVRLLHSAAMDALRKEFEGDAFLVDDLIDRQMRSIADQYVHLRNAVERKHRQRQDGYSVDAASAELALVLFLVLHYYGFSKLPSDFKAGMGGDFSQLHAISEVYKIAYRAGFSHLFGCPMEMGEEDLLMMSAMFFDRDGAGAMDLNMPREEALSTVFMRLDIPREMAKQLIRQFEDQVEAWFAPIAAMSGR